MDSRGRKSAEGLAVVVSIPGQRPDPPEVLGPDERVLWRRIVATRPHDWFTAETWPLLIEYCRAWVASDQVARELEKFDGIPEGQEFMRWLRLRDRQEKTARLLATMATKMRLSQQSRWTEQTAATAAKRTASEQSKPWLYGDDAR